MTKQEYETVMQIIKKYMHIDYLSNGSCKNVLETNSLVYVDREIKEMVKKNG